MRLIRPISFLVADQRAPLARVEKIQERERALGVLALGVSQLLDEDTAELGSGRAVAGLNFLDLRDRLIAGIAKRDVAIGVTGVLPPQPLDECPLALVDSAVASGLLRERTGRGGQDDGD